MVTLREYQSGIYNGILSAWQKVRNVCGVLPTGGGKTIIFGNVLANYQGYSIAIAHRQELVSQISLSLCKFGIRHSIIAPEKVVKWIIGLQAREYGRPFYDGAAPCIVAGVDTVLRRPDFIQKIAPKIGLWVTDECHHLLKSNKWGKAVELFPDAYGLGVTATPERADGRGLSRASDGVMDAMVIGPGMRELILKGFLTDYKIFAPQSDIDLSAVETGATGDYRRGQLTTAVRRSHIIGDVIESYESFAGGKLGVTFVTDVPSAAELAQAFTSRGIPAAAVSAKTPGHNRQAIIDKFRRRELLQLVNVDLFGEGFDLPAIEAISMARPTQSFPLYCQQFGRSLRPMDGKEFAIIIDHVGNWTRHGLPDRPRIWSLEPRERKGPAKPIDTEPMRVCQKCTALYSIYSKACPYCGHVHTYPDRSTPEMVDGDLTELDPATLARLRGQIERIDEPAENVLSRMTHAGAPGVAAYGARNQHLKRQEAQRVLRYSIELYARERRVQGMPDKEIYKRFYNQFGIDVMNAQVLGRPDAERLTKEIFKQWPNK